jgi:hypothetical protein
VTADQVVNRDFYPFFTHKISAVRIQKESALSQAFRQRLAVRLFSGLPLRLRLTGTPQFLSSKRLALCGEVNFEV